MVDKENSAHAVHADQGRGSRDLGNGADGSPPNGLLRDVGKATCSNLQHRRQRAWRQSVGDHQAADGNVGGLDSPGDVVDGGHGLTALQRERNDQQTATEMSQILQEALELGRLLLVGPVAQGEQGAGDGQSTGVPVTPPYSPEVR